MARNLSSPLSFGLGDLNGNPLHSFLYTHMLSFDDDECNKLLKV